MKKHVLLLLLPLVFMIGESAAQTRAETVNWINLKYRNSGLIKDPVNDQQSFLRINRDGSFEIKANLYEPGAIITYKNLRNAYVIRGHFRDLNPESVRYAVEGDRLILYAQCGNNSQCIRQVETKKDKSADSTLANSVMFGPILINKEQGLPAEAVKAFRRLITLDGGKKDSL